MQSTRQYSSFHKCSCSIISHSRFSASAALPIVQSPLQVKPCTGHCRIVQDSHSVGAGCFLASPAPSCWRVNSSNQTCKCVCFFPISFPPIFFVSSFSVLRVSAALSILPCTAILSHNGSCSQANFSQAMPSPTSARSHHHKSVGRLSLTIPIPSCFVLPRGAQIKLDASQWRIEFQKGAIQHLCFVNKRNNKIV